MPRPFLRLSLLDNVVVGAISTEPDDVRRDRPRETGDCRGGPHAQPRRSRERASTPVELRLLELARALAGSPEAGAARRVFAGLAHEEIERLLVVIKRLPREGVTA